MILLVTFVLLIAWSRLYLPFLQRREARSGE